jgi:PhnB protein
MNKFDPYLIFKGNCTEAFGFYQDALGGKIEAMLTVGQSPMAAEIPPGGRDGVLHARLNLDGQVLMGCDAMEGQPYEGMKGFWVSLTYADDNAKAKRIFDALAQEGQVMMPMQKTFWSEAYGMVTDRFGTPWMVQGVMIPI